MCNVILNPERVILNGAQNLQVIPDCDRQGINHNVPRPGNEFRVTQKYFCKVLKL